MTDSATKRAILEKLAEIETLIQEAQCQGQQLAELECFEQVDMALQHLTEQIGYYLD